MSSTTPPSGGGMRLPEPPPSEEQPFERTAGSESPPPERTPDPGQGRGPTWWMMVAAVVLAALVASGVTLAVAGVAQPAEDSGGDAPAAPSEEEPASSSAADTESDGSGEAMSVSGVADAVRPSVPSVEVAGARGQGSASAVIFREDGYLLTNNHVVENAQRLRVTLPDGEQHEAEIVGTDPRSDLAVLELPDAEGLPVPEFAQSSPDVGDGVVAVGSPFGLEGTVTSGIVSAMNREVNAPNITLPDMIQTDAAINPGNSGGALANMRGQVVGINTAILSGSGTNAGVGFAIPIQSALASAEQLVDQGFVEYAQIGILGEDLDPQIAELYGVGADEGVVVRKVVSDSGAEEAGLSRGDIITAIDDTDVSSMSDLIAAVREHSPGDTVTLTVVRGGEERSVDVELTAQRSGEQQRRSGE